MIIQIILLGLFGLVMALVGLFAGTIGSFLLNILKGGIDEEA